MLNRRTAKTYLRANVPMPNKLSMESQKALTPYFEDLKSFFVKFDEHSLESMSWFIQVNGELNSLIYKLVYSFNDIEKEILKEQNPKHSKEIKVLTQEVLNILHFKRDQAGKLFKDYSVVTKSFNAYPVHPNNNGGKMLISCFSAYVSFFQSLEDALTKVIIPKIQLLAEKITDENGMIAAQEIKGGFFSKFYRKANLTLKGRLSQPLILILKSISSLGLKGIHPNMINSAVFHYLSMAKFESLFQDILTQVRFPQQDIWFLRYLSSQAGFFGHYNNGKMNLLEVASNPDIIHNTQKRAFSIIQSWKSVIN